MEIFHQKCGSNARFHPALKRSLSSTRPLEPLEPIGVYAGIIVYVYIYTIYIYIRTY